MLDVILIIKSFKAYIQMITQENISIIVQISTLVGLIFSMYLYFRRPQEKSETNDAVFDVKFTALEKMVINLRDNHLHTIEEKLSRHISESQDVALRNAERMGAVEAKLDMLLKK